MGDCLNPEGWLSDCILDIAFFHLPVQPAPSSSLRTYFPGAYFLKTAEERVKHSRQDTTKRGVFKEVPDQLKAGARVLAPYNPEGNHWCLVALNPAPAAAKGVTHVKATVLESVHRRASAAEGLLKKLNDFPCFKELRVAIDSVTTKLIQAQGNASDCGVATYVFAKHIAHTDSTDALDSDEYWAPLLATLTGSAPFTPFREEMRSILFPSPLTGKEQNSSKIGDDDGDDNGDEKGKKELGPAKDVYTQEE